MFTAFSFNLKKNLFFMTFFKCLLPTHLIKTKSVLHDIL